jgi:Ni,Fe-hydrogenase III component G
MWMDASLKEQLYKLIDDCDDEALLMQAKNILQPEVVKYWWDELTEDDKTSLATSEQQYEQGNFITHAQLMQQFNASLLRQAAPDGDKG